MDLINIKTIFQLKLLLDYQGAFVLSCFILMQIRQIKLRLGGKESGPSLPHGKITLKVITQSAKGK